MPLDASLLHPRQRYVPGILGGLGPLSHVQFVRELLARSHGRGARRDQDHPVWLLASGSSTPDRTQALLAGGPHPAAHLVGFARALERAGADALFVVCNTAHAFHAEVQRAIPIPWVHLMRLVAAAIREEHPRGTRVGILGTDGTLASRLYDDALAAEGLIPVAPPPGSAVRRDVMAAITDPRTGIKATGTAVSDVAREQLVRAAGWCVGEGVAVIVAGCTEISVALADDPPPGATLVDPLRVTADAVLDLAWGRRAPASFLTAAPADSARRKAP
jgi:aspartate racemase